MVVLRVSAKSVTQSVATQGDTASGKGAFSEENKVQDASGFPDEQSMLITLNITDIPFTAQNNCVCKY